jgi:hypothetical protein
MYVNGKVICVETIPQMEGGRMKKNDGGKELNYNVFDML